MSNINDMFVESEHPRDGTGEFTSNGGSSKSAEYESLSKQLGTKNAYQVKHDLAEAEEIVNNRQKLVSEHGLNTALSLINGAKQTIKECRRFLELHESGMTDKNISMDSWVGDGRASNIISYSNSNRTIDENGYLHIDNCVLTGEQVAPYLGSELDPTGKLGLDANTIYGVYRPAEEVEKAADSFKGLPLTDNHVYITPDNSHDNRRVGATGTDTAFKDGKLFNSVHVHVGKAIRDIQRADDEKGGKKDLSCGYTYDLIPESGQFKGEKYHFKMVNIKGNHLALVEDGRHPEAMIADSNINIKGKTQTMSNQSWLRSFLGGFTSDGKNARIIMDSALNVAKRSHEDFAGGAIEQVSVIRDMLRAYDEADMENETERKERDKMSNDKKAKDKKAKDEEMANQESAVVEDEDMDEDDDKKMADKKAKDKKAKDESEEEEEEKKEEAKDEAIKLAKKVVGMSGSFIEDSSCEKIIDNALTKNNIKIKGRAFDAKLAMLEVLASQKEASKPRRVASDSVASSEYKSILGK